MADKSDILELLRIADLSNQWPNLRPLHDHAMAALQKAADEHAEQAKQAKAEAEKKKAAEDAAKAAKTEEDEKEEAPAVKRPYIAPGAQPRG